VFPNVTNVQNVGRVVSRGVELAWQASDLLAGLDVDANAAYVDAKIRASNYLASVGKQWVRVPRIRAHVQATYRVAPEWKVAAAYRYHGRQFGELDNSDVNPDTYGGVSQVRQLDLRLLYRRPKGVELALGINNATDDRAYQSHPLGGRTFFGEVRYAY